MIHYSIDSLPNKEQQKIRKFIQSIFILFGVLTIVVQGSAHVLGNETIPILATSSIALFNFALAYLIHIRVKVNYVVHIYMMVMYFVLAYSYVTIGDMPSVRIALLMIPMIISLLVSFQEVLIWFCLSVICNIVMTAQSTYHIFNLPEIDPLLMKRDISNGFPLITIVFVVLFTYFNKQSMKKVQEINIELESEKREKNKVLNMTSFINHELRNPIHAIQSVIFLLENGEKDEKQKHYYDILKLSSETLIKVVNDSLDFAKLDAGKLQFKKEKIEIHDFLVSMQSQYKELAEKKGISQEIYCDNEISYIVTDTFRLSQILSNLMSNAVKYSKTERLVLSAFKEGAHCKIIVKDFGVGMEQSYVNIMFDQWSQSDISNQTKGSGLGMSIVKKLLDTMGYTISVDSTVGEGSAFIISIPLS